MIAHAPTSVQRLKQVRKEWPEAAVLAEPLALAVRIEPELLRDVRLALAPASHASLEADLYFSPLISQRTPEWLSVDPPLAHELQKRLAVGMRRGGKDEERVRRVRAMERAHSTVPFEIAREEQIIWMSVEQAGGKAKARQAVNEVLRGLLFRMLQGGDVSVALARWFAGAAKRMPPLARETESFTLLVFASSSILGGREIEAKINATLDTFEALARYPLQFAKRVTVWGALTARGLHLRPEQYVGYQSLEMPLTNPLLLEARPENGSPILVQVSPGQTAFVPLPAGVIALRTLSRDLLIFRPRSATAPRAEAVRAEHERPIGKIFIGYRRDDSAASAGRLYDDLITHFPSNNIFMDIQNLEPGVDFVEAIQESVASCDVLIAVIGKRWLISSDGRRRLDNPEDFVRIEIATALKRGVPVIPVLVDDASMPRSSDLPDDLKPLIRRHALEISHTRFKADLERLIGAVERALEKAKAAQHQPPDVVLRVLTGHDGGVNSVAFSPDGTRIVSGSRDNTLQMWDLESGQSLLTLEGHTSDVTAVAVTPDGRRALSASSDKTLRIWDLESGESLRTLEGHTGWVTAVAVTPDGRRALSASSDKTLRIWDLESGESLRTLEGHTGWVTAVAVTPNGRRALSASSDKTLRVWDLESGESLRTLEGHTDVVAAVALSSEGTRIVSGSRDNTLRLWDAKSGEPIRAPLLGHENSVSSVAFSPEGTRIVSGSRDNTLRLWDAKSGEPIRAPLLGHENSVSSVAFSPEGTRIVSGSEDKTLRVWRII